MRKSHEHIVVQIRAENPLDARCSINTYTRREGMGRIVRHVFLKMDLIVFKKFSN